METMMKYEPQEVWALAHTNGKPVPFVTALTAYTRRDLIREIEERICGKGNWRKWARKSGAKCVKAKIYSIDDVPPNA